MKLYSVALLAVSAADFDRDAYQTYIDRAAPAGNFKGCTRADGATGLNAGNCKDYSSACASVDCYCCWTYASEDPNGWDTRAIL